MVGEGELKTSEIQYEQAYIDRAHDCLESARRRVRGYWEEVPQGPGGTQAARYERDVMEHKVFQRLAELDLGNRSLCFGRIDTEASGETFYIGRVGVWDDEQNQVVSDWRAPVAEPFFRAGSSQPMGICLRRHFSTRGRELLGISDERFRPEAQAALDDTSHHLVGEGALRSALVAPRTGRLPDVTATIQAEQDAVIRSPLSGVLIVQGGPGTGKTVVALHRAAYLIYTHRFPLATQGVLVIGPNPVFLTYVEQVLPSLGEAGVDLVTIGGLVPDVTVKGYDEEATARLKGDERMREFLRLAVRDRRQPLRKPLEITHGLQRLTLSVAASKEIVAGVGSSGRPHNSCRRILTSRVFEALASSARSRLSPEEVADAHRESRQIREALEWMWPILSPAQLLHDLFGSRALLRSAGRTLLEGEAENLYRPRSPHPDSVVWKYEDVPLLDEAQVLLGPRPGQARENAFANIRTYGHVVVDEAQDLSPMQLGMVGRRSLSGSFTLVGDIAQSSGAWPHNSWESIINQLSPRSGSRFAELSIGYRLPQSIMKLAASVGIDNLSIPKSVREEGDPPWFRRVRPADLAREAALSARGELDSLRSGNLVVICASAMADAISQALRSVGVDHVLAEAHALEKRVSVVPVRLVKGLEVDVAVLVEPSQIVADGASGLRMLYVALTRATRRLCVVHSQVLPPGLARAAAAIT